MFDHSIKVPRLYKTAAQIAEKAATGVSSVKQLVYAKKHPNIKAVYALAVEALRHNDQIERIIKKLRLFEREPRFKPWLAKILITELLFGKKRLAGTAKPIQTILAYEQMLRAYNDDFTPIPEHSDESQDLRPRYVRVNTLKTTMAEVINVFRNEGWILCRLPDDATYDNFLEKVKQLSPEEFLVDFHLPDLLVFPSRTQFHGHELYKDSTIVLQDKASCLPIHILNPTPDSIFLDMCAAPGMKTTHAATVMQNKGTIYAVDMDTARYVTLKKLVESFGATCVQFINCDVLTLQKEHCKDVEYILVDPSCTGSGISNRINIELNQYKTDAERLQKLAGFQIKILRHALNHFPHSKRVVYSTCSMFPEENEDVVRQVLETSQSFKLVDARSFLKREWKNVGNTKEFGKLGELCLYAKPQDDLTQGFFVAVFERLKNGEKNQFLNTQIIKLRNKKRKRQDAAGNERQIRENKNDLIESVEEEVQKPNKKKKKKAEDIKDEEEETSKSPIKKKKKKQKISIENLIEETLVEHTLESSHYKKFKNFNIVETEEAEAKKDKKDRGNESQDSITAVELVATLKKKKKKHLKKVEEKIENGNETTEKIKKKRIPKQDEIDDQQLQSAKTQKLQKKRKHEFFFEKSGIEKDTKRKKRL